MEGVVRRAAVVGRVGQRPDYLQELHDGAGPAVGDDERPGAGHPRTDVQEVNAQAVDVGLELRDGIEPGLGGAPVVAVAPVLAQLADVGQRNALAPVVDGLGVGPACARQPLAQVVEVGLANVDAERSDVIAHGVFPFGEYSVRNAPEPVLLPRGAGTTVRRRVDAR